MSTHETNFDLSVSEKPLHIDIEVKLAEVKVVFSIGALEFEGDLPASIFHLQLIKNDIVDWNAYRYSPRQKCGPFGRQCRVQDRSL